MALKVSVAHPQIATVTNWDEYPAHLEAVEMVEVRPRLSGHIESIHFQDGAEVKQGDLLFVIDPKPYQAELEHAKAQKRQLETRLELARNDLKRAEGLRGTKAISDEEYDSRNNAVRVAEAAMEAARAAEQTAQINLDYTQIKAPISGRIGRRLITVGNFVQSTGANVLATIVSVDPVYCYFDADERAFLNYRNSGTGLGQKDCALMCELALDTETGFPHRGTVDFYDNQVDKQMGTIRLRATFQNANRELIPGLFARVRVPAGKPTEAMLIPDVAVSFDQKQKFVYVVNQQNLAEVKPIQADRRHGTSWAVLKGLTTEDRVIVNGLLMLRKGVPVQIVDPAAPTPDGPGAAQARN